MKLKKNFYLNFSSIPELTKKAKKLKFSYKNTEINKIIKLASSKGFYGVEFPYYRFFKNSESLQYLLSHLNKENQKYILDCEKKITKKELVNLIGISKKIGAKFIRVKCSNILSCQRYKYNQDWKLKVNSIIKKINQIKPLLKEQDVKLAIENHQDLDSNDLRFIIKKVGSKYVGINFDVGNSFATCEIPLIFLKRVKNYILNIHLKDYIIFETKKGYALQRCPIMDGDSEIHKVLDFIKIHNLNVPISIELGAKTPREIKIRSKKYFQNFIYEKKIKLENSKKIMKIAIKNSKKIHNLKKLISLSEINMLNKSLKNLNQL